MAAWAPTHAGVASPSPLAPGPPTPSTIGALGRAGGRPDAHDAQLDGVGRARGAVLRDGDVAAVRDLVEVGEDAEVGAADGRPGLAERARRGAGGGAGAAGRGLAAGLCAATGATLAIAARMTEAAMAAREEREMCIMGLQGS